MLHELCAYIYRRIGVNGTSKSWVVVNASVDSTKLYISTSCVGVYCISCIVKLISKN